MQGNAVVAQSGGPTAVINSSACGVIQECQKHRQIKRIFGAKNGILGILHEELFDLGEEDPQAIEGLRRTPSAALGSCRYKLKSLEESRKDFERILEVFKVHDIRYFFYIGGNDSMDTADKVGILAKEMDYDLIVMGIPKTIDNDLAFTDHCPGYGSVAKYIATTVMEAGRDTEALYTADTATVLETMGRNAGWIAGAAGLARRSQQDAPHLIYMPEVPFSIDRFLDDVKAVYRDLGRVFIVASEGLVDEEGKYITAQEGMFAKDAFGHRQLGGVAETLKNIVEREVGIKCRFSMIGTCQRNAAHFASKTDSDEAYLVGQMAVRHAVEGTTGFMVTLQREDSPEYRCTTGLARLSDVANSLKKVPREWINEEGNFITQQMRDYVRPLVLGEVPIKIGPDGLPEYVRLRRRLIEGRLSPYSVQS
ncbi:MAG TPA: 6-phosphofructokinase [Candidatus Latescibacteria bacterium]|nr:6-phosphofructokinase [Candidatus Latescibacterota bacterium]